MRSLALLVAVLGSLAASCALVVDLASLASAPPLVPDASGDASADAQADAGTEASLGFCAARGDADTLCADFDEGSLASGWSTIVFATDGGIALSDASFTSPSAAARIIASGKSSYFEEKTALTASVLDVQMEVLLDDETDGTLQLVSIVLLAGNYPQLLLEQAYGGSTGTSIVETNVHPDSGRTTVGTYAFGKSVLPRTWTTLAIHIESSTLTVSLGGQLVVDEVLSPSSTWIAGHYLVEIGAVARSTPAAVDLALDDIAMRVR